jgi:translation initiation factor 2B subunit (eIF-2B alpha/beta/delta family)
LDIFKIFKENKLVESVNSMQQAAKTTSSLISLISDNKVSLSVRDMLKGLRTILTEKPNIASVNHFINHFLLQIDPENQPIVIKELLEVFHERWKHVDRKTAEVANSLFDFEHKTIILHGKDMAVQSLIELMQVNQKKVNIIQLISTSDEHSKEQASNLATLGIPVKTIESAAAGKYLAQADAVLMGCEIVMHERFIVRSGAHVLCAAARHYNKPVFVLADSRKILNKKYFPQSVLDRFIGKYEKPASELWKDAPNGVEVDFDFIEEVPNTLVSNFVFEKQAYTPEELTEQVDKVLITRFF